MDLKKTGEFIAEQRKLKGFTQAQLAQKISVSEQTISKWECGKGFPDASLILPLCDALEITANELLSSCKLSTDKEYREKAERNLVQLKNEQERSNKYLLLFEWVIVWLGIVVLVGSAMVAAYVEMATVWRVLLLVFGYGNLFGTCFLGLWIEAKVGFYECAHCKHKYVPTYKSVLVSMHCGRLRYMKCPKCNRRSWQKKKINND